MVAPPRRETPPPGPIFTVGPFYFIPPVMRKESKVQEAIREAMGDREVIYDPVNLPARINGRKTKVISVRDNIVKIQESKPIEFLMRLMMDGYIDYPSVDEDGNINSAPVPLQPKERVKIAMFLANKLMPTMHVIKSVGEDDEPPAKSGFDALVDEAINRSRNGR